MFNRIVIAGICLAASFVVAGCSQRPDASYTPTNRSDQNWVNGIARNWSAAFFVKNSAEAKNDLAVGRYVIFSDGTVRRIVGQKENKRSLIVFLDGTPLDGNVVGYPKVMTVTDQNK